MQALWRYTRLCYILLTASKDKERLPKKILMSHSNLRHRYMHIYFKKYGVDEFYLYIMQGGTTWKRKK